MFYINRKLNEEYNVRYLTKGTVPYPTVSCRPFVDTRAVTSPPAIPLSLFRSQCNL